MATSLQDFFALYETRPVTGECHKQLGVLLKQCPPAEVEHYLLTYHPTELHLQLLRALVARTLGSISILLEGIRSESKEVSKFCAESASLYSSKNSGLYCPNILLPLLQTVSYATRNKILINLARHMSDGYVDRADCLFESIVDLWGPAAAMPLLCRTSEAVIQREIENGHSLSSIQILTIVRRYPKLAMLLLEKCNLSYFSLKAARFVVRKNLPESLNYCVKNRYQKLLSKTTMRRVLRNHMDFIMASPSDWASILDVECVEKVLKPDVFESLVLKLVEHDLKNSCYVSCYPPSYIQHLPSKAVSSVINKVGWAAYEDFWENNESLLKLMETDDRNRIASELFEKTKNLDWVTFMSCDLSIPIIKENLSSEANAHIRAGLVEKLLRTVDINKNKNSFEDICEFTAVRYRNDRDVISTFFENLPDMTSAAEKTWTMVYSLAAKFLDPSSSTISYGISRLFSAALKRNGRSGLKIYIDRLFNQRMLNCNATQDFTDLDADLREECVSLIFTSANVASDNSERARCLMNLLSVISKWNTSSVQPIKSENVNKFVLKNLDNQSAVDFVLNKYNGFAIDVIEKCFEVTGNPDLLRCMVQKKPVRFSVSKAAVEKMTNDLIDCGCWKYIKLLKTLKRKGYLDILRYICDKSLAAIRDPDHQSRRHAIILLSLSVANVGEYLQETHKFLDEMEVGEELVSPFLSHPEPTDCQDQENILKQSQQKYSIYEGIGNSFTFVDTPSLIVDLLLKFCINGDMMLFVRDSVYSVSFSLPAANATDLLAQLVHKPVSVMKHALRIHQLLSDIKTQRGFLMELIQTETHLTVRTCLFEYALSSLHNTKNVYIWEAIKEMMLRLTPKDKALVTLLRGKNVPLPFWEQFVKLLLEKTECLEDVTIENVSSILDKICDSKSITNQFHESLIKAYFLSDRYFPNVRSHHSVCNILVAYLAKKAPPGSQPDVVHQKLLLANTLGSASKEAIVAYDAKLGYHPTTVLLGQFVQLVSTTCRQQEKNGVANNMNNLSIFIDTLMSFFTQVDENLLFGPFVCVSLTDITCRQSKETSKSTGYLIGQLIDRTYAKNAGLAQYALPVFVESFFAGSTLDACIYQDLLLSPEPHNQDTLLIRQFIVTKILPSNWKKDKSLESFREKYMMIVQNTPSEVILFADEG